jgi:hypothetical protein
MSAMAWPRAWADESMLAAGWRAAWSRATRMVTVKETRSGSIPAVLAASARRAHSAW